MLGRDSFLVRCNMSEPDLSITNLWSVIPEYPDKACHGNAKNSFPGHLGAWWLSWTAHENTLNPQPNAALAYVCSQEWKIVWVQKASREIMMLWGVGWKGTASPFSPVSWFLRLNFQASLKGEDIPGMPGNHCHWWSIDGIYSAITLTTICICRQIFSHLYINTLFMLQHV